MKLTDFDYDLPEELIAQTPIEKRDESRLLVLDKLTGEYEDKIFKDILDYLQPGDCLVRNNTKVIPARLYGKKETGANVEFVLLKELETLNETFDSAGNCEENLVEEDAEVKSKSENESEVKTKFEEEKAKATEKLVVPKLNAKAKKSYWEAMVRPGNKLHKGAKVIFGDGLLEATIIDTTEDGTRKVEFSYDGIFNEILDKIGLMPLPPYIHESLEENDRYQTVYAKYEGSAAAPTAGLHFTPELLKKIEEKGVEIANVTLHVGIGTFRPVKEENIEDHHMHKEHYYIKQEDADKINKAKREGHRVICVGTTSCRTVESIADENGYLSECEGDTGIYIYPGYKFKCMDALITNFHLPESTLLMLVSAFAGRENILKAYKHAVAERYRFFSFGDAMFIK